MNVRFKRGLIEFEQSAETSLPITGHALIAMSGDWGWASCMARIWLSGALREKRFRAMRSYSTCCSIEVCGSEAVMRGISGLVICCLFVFGGSAVLLHASTLQFQKAVVVSTEKYEPEAAHHGKFTDAPAPSSEYDANISIRLNCLVYLGRYKSPIDYLPGVFVPGQSIEVSPARHFLYVRVPGTGEVKLRIVRRDLVAGDSCNPSR